jgi:choice-of-anchor A domain-containing protein
MDPLEDRVALSSGAISLGAAAQFALLGLDHTSVVNLAGFSGGSEGVSKGGTLVNLAPSVIAGDVIEASRGEYIGNGRVTGTVSINSSVMAQAGHDALAASIQAASLYPTQSFGKIAGPTTITGNGGLNVIAINGPIRNSLTLRGSASDVFVVNVSGDAQLLGHAALGLAGGVTADHVLYNFTSSHGSVDLLTQGELDGTFLGPGASFNVWGAVHGALIGGGGSIALLPGAAVAPAPFVQPGQPASLAGVVTSQGSGLAGVTVSLVGTDLAGNAMTCTATTDDNGDYAFSGLPAGTYMLEPPALSGYAPQSTVGQVNGIEDGTIISGDAIDSIVLQPGESGTGYDFEEISSIHIIA